MEADFKKTRIITIAMIGAVIAYGVVALMISERHGYGASSEAKMNFLRLMVFIFSMTQVVLAFAIQKSMKKMAGNMDSQRQFKLQLVINCFCEVIALFGLVLTMMSKTFMDYVLFAAISLAAFIFFFPKSEQVRD